MPPVTLKIDETQKGDHVFYHLSLYSLSPQRLLWIHTTTSKIIDAKYDDDGIYYQIEGYTVYLSLSGSITKVVMTP